MLYLPTGIIRLTYLPLPAQVILIKMPLCPDNKQAVRKKKHHED